MRPLLSHRGRIGQAGADILELDVGEVRQDHLLAHALGEHGEDVGDPHPGPGDAALSATLQPIGLDGAGQAVGRTPAAILRRPGANFKGKAQRREGAT